MRDSTLQFRLNGEVRVRKTQGYSEAYSPELKPLWCPFIIFVLFFSYPESG